MGIGNSTTGQVSEIRITTQTYTRDSYGLFDFDGKEHKIKQFDMSRTGMIGRREFETCLTEKMVNKKDFYNQIKLNFRDDTIFLERVETQLGNLMSYDEKKLRLGPDFYERFVWMNIKNYQKGYPLEEGDVFRIGRLRFRVREVFLGKVKQKVEYQEGRIARGKAFGEGMNLNRSEHKIETDENMLCRICLEGETQENQFADVCDCTKSNPLHADCLIQWIENKIQKKETPYFDFYSWKFLDCDLCKVPFPEFFMCNNKRYDLLVMQRPIVPFIAIDLFNKEENTIRGCFVVKNDTKQKYTIGRGTDCEIRLSDISVSRNHATLSYEKGYWQLTDAKSKFGTLLLVDEPVDLRNQKKQSNFQIGKTVVIINMKQTEEGMCVCGKKTDESGIQLNPFEVIEDDPEDLKSKYLDHESVVYGVNDEKPDIEKNLKLGSSSKDGQEKIPSDQGHNNLHQNMALNQVPEYNLSHKNSENKSNGVNQNEDGNVNNNHNSKPSESDMIGINIAQHVDDLSDVFENEQVNIPNQNNNNSNPNLQQSSFQFNESNFPGETNLNQNANNVSSDNESQSHELEECQSGKSGPNENIEDESYAFESENSDNNKPNNSNQPAK